MREQIVSFLAPRLREALGAMPEAVFANLTEVRLRVHRPLILATGSGDYTIAGQELSRDLDRGPTVSPEDLERTLQALTECSVYAVEEDIKRGFITIPGGHRVGIAGSIWTRDGEVAGFRFVSGLSIRIARAVEGSALPYRSWFSAGGHPVSGLVIGPPASGKTTLLRDLARLFASGPGAVNVTVVDERSEIAACYRGVPQLDTGTKSDVIDACPKSYGMMMAIRALSPRLIITDEIGRPEDVTAIRECVNAGVAVIASAHAASLEELARRPGFAGLIGDGCFERGLVLAGRPRPGTVVSRLDFRLPGEAVSRW